jgi:hypothetical protein
MPRSCSVCISVYRKDVEARLLAGERPVDVERFIAAKGSRLSRDAIYRHKKHIAIGGTDPQEDAIERVLTPPDLGENIYEQIVNLVSAQIANGVLRPSVRDAIIAQKYLDERARAAIEAKLAVKIGAMLLAREMRASLPAPTNE